MRTGALVSAIGHGAVIGLAIFGLPWFSARESTPIRVTEVEFVSQAEFAALQAAAPGPRAPEARPEPVEEVLVAPETPAVAEPPPAAPEPEPEPEVATLAPGFDPATPLAPAPEGVTLVPPVASLDAVAPPRSRPVERIAAIPAPAPPEAARPAETPLPELSSEPAPEPIEARPAEAPPEAAPPAAAPTPPAPTAPAASPGLVAQAEPPRPRPANLARPQAQVAATQPERTPEREPEPATPPTVTAATPPTESTPPTPPAQQPDVASQVAAAVAAARAASETGAAETSLPEGPPISGAEREGLRLAVQRCWNVPAGLRDAQELKITLAAELTAQGDVISSSIRMIEPATPPDGRFQQAYEAGRRALIRCAPYTSLPREKYAQWRNIEVVFNPEGMVSW